jgi:hypothetical protein
MLFSCIVLCMRCCSHALFSTAHFVLMLFSCIVLCMRCCSHALFSTAHFVRFRFQFSIDLACTQLTGLFARLKEAPLKEAIPEEEEDDELSSTPQTSSPAQASPNTASPAEVQMADALLALVRGAPGGRMAGGAMCSRLFDACGERRLLGTQGSEFLASFVERSRELKGLVSFVANQVCARMLLSPS